jgi:hypothetical protein
MQYGHVHTCAMIKKTKNHQNSSKVKCMSSAKYDQIYCIVTIQYYFYLHTCFTHNDKNWFNRNKILSVAQIHHIFFNMPIHRGDESSV